MKFLFVILTLFGSAAMADSVYEDFRGNYITTEGDCKEGLTYKLVHDANKETVSLIREDGKDKPLAVIPETGPTSYIVNKNKQLIITSPHLALNPEKESQYGEKGGLTIYLNVKTVQLDKNLQNQDGEAVLMRTELNLSKDRKTLVYYDMAADFISDPHETVCYLKLKARKF